MTPRAHGAPRRSKKDASRREILVITEGEKTEDGYLLPWRREYRDSVIVTIDPFHGVPLSLVNRAVDVKKAEARDAKRSRGRPHDEIWCMFDIDVHPNIDEALQKAVDNGIHLAISNPCIELWFILHFEDQTAHIERHDAQRRSSDLLDCGKNLTPEAGNTLMAEFEGARQRALALDAKHTGDGSPARSNPSSSIWSLIDSIRR